MSNKLFNKKKFSYSVIEGVISSCVLFFLPYGVFRGSVDDDGIDVTDVQSFGTVVAAILVVTVNLRVSALDNTYNCN